MKSSQAGYSLVEMLTVIAIIGILALVTVPAFMNFYMANKVKTSVRNFSTDLRRVRQMAISNGVQSRLSYTTGSAGNARSYDFYLGDRAVGTPVWTARTLPTSSGSGATGYTRQLEDVVYFPSSSATTPQTFTDIDGDGKLDVIFFPNGSVQMPGTQTTASITVRTDKNVGHPVYQIDISPSGRVLVH
jgi:prepilin-type N-terminal cleavage/methylation domain-containing protein